MNSALVSVLIPFITLFHTPGFEKRLPRTLLEICQKPEKNLLSEYLDNLGKILARGNPEIFVGPFEIDRFCFDPVLGDHFGGNAEPKDRSLNIRRATVMVAQNDAIVAAVLAHEMSHILYQHGMPEVYPHEWESHEGFVKNNERRLILRDKMEIIKQKKRNLLSERYQIVSRYQDPSQMPPDVQAQLKKINRSLDELDDEIDTLDPEYQRVLDQHFGFMKENPEPKGWQEQEADELGFLIFLRAGFHPQGFYQAIMETMTEDEYQKCERDYLSKINLPQPPIPPRTIGDLVTHPESCWRLFNVMLIEPQYHGDEYKDLMRKAIHLEVLPGALDQIKKGH